MRQIVIGIVAYLILQLFIPHLWERFMSEAPAWITQLVFFVLTAGCLTLIALSGPVYARLSHPSAHPVTSTAVVAIMLAAMGATAWWQFVARKPIEKAARAANVLLVETRLILPENEADPVRIAFGIMNTGNSDATFTLKDRTYYFSTDPKETVFSYLPAPPETIRVSAIRGAIWRGEMRFDIKLTPERLEALKTAKARLFFYARGECKDANGKKHPIPFAAMYDAMLTGNLAAPPNNIVFK